MSHYPYSIEERDKINNASKEKLLSGDFVIGETVLEWADKWCKGTGVLIGFEVHHRQGGSRVYMARPRVRITSEIGLEVSLDPAYIMEIAVDIPEDNEELLNKFLEEAPRE